MLLHTSLTSRCLDYLGRALIGTPQALGLGEGFEDFYMLPGDRVIVPITDAQVERQRITVNVFRRLLFTRIAVIASSLSLALCVAGLIVINVLGGVAHLVH